MCAAKPIWRRTKAARPQASSRKIIDHRVIVLNPVGALAHLARACALQNDTIKAKAAFALALVMSVVALAQDTMKQNDSMNHSGIKWEKMSKTAVSLSGKVGEDGNTFVGDKDGKSWKVNNPEVFKGHEGHHVRVKAHVDADKDEIHVASVKMLKSEMKAPHKMK